MVNWVVTTIMVQSDGSAAEALLARVGHSRELRVRGSWWLIPTDGFLVVWTRTHCNPHNDPLESTMRQQVGTLPRPGVRAEFEIVASTPDAARAIANLATRRAADLIVTRKMRRGAMWRRPIGSVPRRLIRLAPYRVLVVS